MSNLKRIILTVIAICTFSVITGCSGTNSDEPIALVVVIGRHANQNEFSDRLFEAVEPLINRAVYGGTVAVIRADGRPQYTEILTSEGIPANFEQDARNSIVRDSRIREYSDTVTAFLRSDMTKAQQSEVDLLGALNEAARVLHGSPLKERHIVLMSTGISTAGRVDFKTFDLNTLDIPEYVAALSEVEGILPELAGVNITFIGLGDVAEPQIMPDTTLPILRSFWEEIFAASGVRRNMMQFPVSPSGTRPNFFSEDEGGFPFVTVINFSQHEIAIRHNTEAATEIVLFDEEPEAEPESVEVGELLLPNVEFIPGSDVLISEETASVILLPYANAMIEHLDLNPNVKLYLVGSTASTATQGGSGNIDLSRKRAERLRHILIELGVPQDNLVAIGVGANLPSHLRVCEWLDGVFCTITAQANRKATVYERHNPDFADILAYNEITLP